MTASLQRCLRLLLALSATAGATNLRNRRGPDDGDGGGVAYLSEALAKFRSFASSSKGQLVEKYSERQAKLKNNAGAAKSEAVKLALQQSVTSDKENYMETQSLYDSMVNFSDSMTSLLTNVARHGLACESTVCGEHATCSITNKGADCICNPGYVGLGQDCHAPYEFLPHLLVAGSASVRTAEVSVCVFADSRIAVVFRQVAGGEGSKDSGHLVVGKVLESGEAQVAPPAVFTVGEGMAFQPVVTGVANDMISIVWRDQPTNGACWMRAAKLGVGIIRGADTAISWGEPMAFCEQQSHKMVLVSLPQGRLAVLFAGSTRSPEGGTDGFGAAVLVGVAPSTAPTPAAVKVLGEYRFAESPLCRLEVTQMSPTSFVVVARSKPVQDEVNPTIVTQQEAMAVYGRLVGDNLVFDPNIANVEPSHGPIWARGVARIAPDTIAYAYQDSVAMKIKMAVLAVDPATHTLQVKASDVDIRSGFSSYVGMLPIPDMDADPHTLTFFDDPQGNVSMISLCSYSAAERKVGRCQDFPWLDQRVESISGVPVGHGRFFFAFASITSVPYYSLFGVAPKGVIAG